MRTYRYFEWATASGGQLSGDQLMDALSDYLTEDGDVSRAMQMLMQRGMSSGEQKMQGLRDMLEQLRKRKQQQLDKYDLNSLLNARPLRDSSRSPRRLQQTGLHSHLRGRPRRPSDAVSSWIVFRRACPGRSKRFANTIFSIRRRRKPSGNYSKSYSSVPCSHS
jgi:hypothetical protein